MGGAPGLHLRFQRRFWVPCARIIVREPSADELVVFSTRRVGKHRDPCCDAALHEIRRFECPRAAGIKRYDNDVGVAFWTFSGVLRRRTSGI